MGFGEFMLLIFWTSLGFHRMHAREATLQLSSTESCAETMFERTENHCPVLPSPSSTCPRKIFATFVWFYSSIVLPGLIELIISLLPWFQSRWHKPQEAFRLGSI